MKTSSSIRTFNENNGYISFDKDIKCPICNKTSHPKFLSGHLNTNYSASLFFYCRLCQNSFIGKIEESSKIELTQYSSEAKHYNIRDLFPVIISVPTIQTSIIDLSIDFSKLYKEATFSEQLGYGGVAGPGYRKALEFLVKDYAISINKDDEVMISKIKKMALGQCIESHIDHPRIKAISKRASWLGNDETHYERKYTEEDIETFKTLINLTMQWIALDIESKYLEDSIVHHSQL